MENNQTEEELTFQLLLDDLEDLENKQKGKQAAGEPTDTEVAIELMRQEILAAQLCIEDGKLAHSISTGRPTDRNLLASSRHEERLAGQGHRNELALNNGEPKPGNASCASTAGEGSSTDNTDNADDAVVVGIEGRMGLMIVKDNGEGSSRSTLTSWRTSNGIKCVACLELHDSAIFVGSCGHEFCHDCTREMFLGAIRDEQLYPPRCCGNVIPTGLALQLLNDEEQRDFGQRSMESTAKDRLYCADPTCSKFIPPFLIKDEHGPCRECGRLTHVLCRSLAHPGVDCPLDEPLQGVLTLADTEKWRRCFKCRHMVELEHGCNHITCRCGSQFCYVCGNVWKTCTCPQWHENRLLATANRAVDGEVPRNANAAARNNALNQIINDLQQHQHRVCRHHEDSQWTYRDRGSLQCEVCNYALPDYIFMCTNCRMRACFRCRMHRLR